MKREYTTPVMVFEKFTPDESIALGCTLDPNKNQEPETILCYYYANKSYTTCSCKDFSRTVFMQGNSGCSIQANTSGGLIATNGVEACKEDFVDGRHKTGNHVSAAYRWPNEYGGYHYVKKGSINTVSGTYFNS